MDTRRWLAAAWLLAAAQAATAQQPDARAATGARPARAGAPMPPPYGPVLYVNGKPVQDTGPRNPAEVQDEADTGANPAAQPAAPHSQPQQQRGKQQVRRRRPAWQAGTEPMAPRPLHGDQDTAGQGVPIPPPAGRAAAGGAEFERGHRLPGQRLHRHFRQHVPQRGRRQHGREQQRAPVHPDRHDRPVLLRAIACAWCFRQSHATIFQVDVYVNVRT